MTDIRVIRYGNALKGVYSGTQQAVLTSCIEGTALAKALAPEDTGLERNSIGYSTELKTGGYNEGYGGQSSSDFLTLKGEGLEGYYGSANSYAPYLEYGTRTMVAQPHITPSAAAITGAKSISTIKKELNESMEKEVKKGTKATRIR